MTLKQHWDSRRDVALLHETHFDWMVLQGQSEEPSFERAQLERDMYPYVAKLVDAGRETYLAACVIYAALFGRSPAGNRFTEGLDERTASTLQGVAADTVAAYVQP